MGIIEKFKQGGEDSPGLITRIKDAFSQLTDSLKEMQTSLKVAQLNDDRCRYRYLDCLCLYHFSDSGRLHF